MNGPNSKRVLFPRGHYVGIHSSGFRDFILKPEALRAVVDCGFEHPSEGETVLKHIETRVSHVLNFLE